MKSDHLLLIVRLSLALCCMVVAAGAQTRLYTLENDRLRLSLDDKAAVVHLSNKQSVSGHNYVSRPLPGFWSLIFRRGSSLENVIEPQMQSYRIEQDGQTLRVAAGKLRWRGEELEIRLNFTIRLAGDELIWQAKVENRSDAEVTEFFFPTIGGIARLEMEGVTDDLIWPQ
ncbi:MAG: hypothetical protein ACREEM_52505, partial [Blastocatellia bacterium]